MATSAPRPRAYLTDELKTKPELNRWRPKVGLIPRITDAELITVAALQALLGHHDEARWIRHARKTLRHLFPLLPKQPGYNKRLRTLIPQLQHMIRVLACDTDLWQHPIRVADSTPVECGRSRETVKRSALAGWAGYGSSYVKRCAERSWWGYPMTAGLAGWATSAL
jgi:hypothetical protein